MKNKDVLAMEKAKIVEKMNQAIKDDDTKAFSEAFTELCQKIEDNVLEQAKEMLVEQDATILAQRGVRQLTSKEKQYYEKIIEAMRSTDPKQALNDVEVVMPETIIDSVFDELQTNHPLLSKLNATDKNDDEYKRRAESSMGQADSQDHRGADLWIQRGRCNTGKTERIPAGFQGYAGFRTDMAGYIRASGAL